MSLGMDPKLVAFVLSIFGCLAAAGLTKKSIPSVCRLFEKAGWVKPNYKGKPVPMSAGILLVLIFSGSMLVLYIFEQLAVYLPITETQAALPARRQLETILLLSFGMSLLGLADDLLGTRETGGLKGHLMKFIRSGEISTGLLKAVGGGLLGLAAAFSKVEPKLELPLAVIFVLIDGLVIALSANFINLLDVRPGRAVKGVLLLLGVLLFFVPISLSIPLMILAGIMAVYFQTDAQAKAMLGDAGSNFLGAVTGYLAVAAFNEWVTLAAACSLLLIHAYTETHSLTKLIESNKVLIWIDRLGQEKAR